MSYSKLCKQSVLAFSLSFLTLGSAYADLLCAKIQVKKGRSSIVSRTVTEAKCPRGFKTMLDLTAFQNQILAAVPAFNGAAAGGSLSGTYPNPSLADESILPDHLSALPAVILRASTFNTANNTPLSISFDAENYDTDNFFTFDNNDEVTVPRAGLYLISAHIGWAGNATGSRTLFIAKNNSGTHLSTTENPGNTGSLGQRVNGLMRLAAGDAVALRAHQSSGGALGGFISGSGNEASAASLSVLWVGP
jgi:hypothetical protein